MDSSRFPPLPLVPLMLSVGMILHHDGDTARLSDQNRICSGVFVNLPWLKPHSSSHARLSDVEQFVNRFSEHTSCDQNFAAASTCYNACRSVKAAIEILYQLPSSQGESTSLVQKDKEKPGTKPTEASWNIKL